MKRRNLLIAVAAILVMFAFVACSESVASEDRLGTITFGENSSRAVGTVVTYSNEVENMVWLYKATKLDDGYTTGQTSGFVAVAAPTSTTADSKTIYTAVKGLSGKTLNNNFSYGLWKIELQGYKEENVTASSDGVAINSGASEKYEYSAIIDNFLVNSGANYAKAEIQLGKNPETKIVFDATKGISFTASNIKADSDFTLAVEDNKGKVTVSTADDDVVKAAGSVTFKNLTYTLTSGAEITGEHTMNFVLTQTLSGEGNTTINAALYTLKFTVQPGTTTTISGTLLKNDETGTIQINSVQDVPELTLSKVLSVENVDSTNNIATVLSDAKINYGDFEVIYPAGTVISTTAGSLSDDNTTADAKIGFEYKETAEQTGITIESSEAKMTFELTLSASTSTDTATKNSTLITVKKFIGKGLTISKIYHADKELVVETSATLPTDGNEGYYYDSSTGYLTLYVLHASEFNIITKEAVASVGDTKYYSLSEAITEASAGDTVTLLRPIMFSENITVSKSITLDMARKAITGSGSITVGENGIVTVLNSAAARLEFIKGIGISSSGSDGVFYPTFSDAVEAATTGSTITLLKDTSLDESCQIQKNLTIDLNNCTLTIGNSDPFICIGTYDGKVSCEVTIKNGKLVTNRTNSDPDTCPCVFTVHLDCKLILDNVEVIDSTMNGLIFNAFAIYNYQGNGNYSTTFIVKNSKITLKGKGANAVRAFNCQEGNKPINFTVINSTIDTSASGSSAVAVGGYDGPVELNISNSTLRSECTVLELNGYVTATIKDSTIESTQEQKKTSTDEYVAVNAPIYVYAETGDNNMELTNLVLKYNDGAIDGHVYAEKEAKYSTKISGTISDGQTVNKTIESNTTESAYISLTENV